MEMETFRDLQNDLPTIYDYEVEQENFMEVEIADTKRVDSFITKEVEIKDDPLLLVAIPNSEMERKLVPLDVVVQVHENAQELFVEHGIINYFVLNMVPNKIEEILVYQNVEVNTKEEQTYSKKVNFKNY